MVVGDFYHQKTTADSNNKFFLNGNSELLVIINFM